MESKKRVLIAEDDDRTRELYHAILDDLYDVVDVSDGVPALGLIDAGERFDLLITDMKMVKMNGDELIEALCARGFSSPIILVTGFITSSHAEMLGRSAHILIKPLHIEEFTELVRSCLAS